MLQSKPDATAPEVRGDLLDHSLRDILTFDPNEPVEAASPNRLLHRDDNRIFFSGFHHDLSRWWTGGDAGALSVCDWTGSVFGDETTALCVDLGGADAWVEDRRPAGESSYDFYFRFDFSQAQIVGEQVFFEARTSSGSLVLQLKVRSGASGEEIGAFAFDNGGIPAVEWVDFGGQGYVRGRWEAGPNAVFQGALGFSPRSPEIDLTFPIGDTSNLEVSQVRLGAVATVPAAGGIQRFRQFRSWRQREADLNFPTFDP